MKTAVFWLVFSFAFFVLLADAFSLSFVEDIYFFSTASVLFGAVYLGIKEQEKPLYLLIGIVIPGLSFTTYSLISRWMNCGAETFHIISAMLGVLMAINVLLEKPSDNIEPLAIIFTVAIVAGLIEVLIFNPDQRHGQLVVAILAATMVAAYASVNSLRLAFKTVKKFFRNK